MTVGSGPGHGRFLLLPMPPTPNGRLHLGHASGPYLRADVLCRHLRRLGAEVQVASGTDPYENWVLLDGLRSGRTPAETCNHFYHEIQSDLVALDIACDEFVNPLDERHTFPYAEVHRRLLDDLARRDAIDVVDEPFPVSQGSGRVLVGVWLFGRCPNCRSDTYGNACEKCGYHYQPSEILDPHGRLDEGLVAWSNKTCWFLRPPPPAEVLAAASSYGLDGLIEATVGSYVDRTGARVRLTLPEEWGIHLPTLPAGTVASNSYFGYCLYLASLTWRSAERDWAGAFRWDSGITTVALFGIDNAIAGVVTPLAIAARHGELKPFDHIATNHFMLLDRKKFSTSRNHAIWVGELMASGLVDSDEVRLQLALRCPELEESDFSVDGLVADVNCSRRLLLKGVTRAIGSAPNAADEEATRSRLRSATQMQGAALDPGRLRVAEGARVLLEWLELGSQTGDAPGRAWLEGVAYLGEPYIPKMAKTIERHLSGAMPLVREGVRSTWPDAERELTRSDLLRVVHTGS